MNSRGDLARTGGCGQAITPGTEILAMTIGDDIVFNIEYHQMSAVVAFAGRWR